MTSVRSRLLRLNGSSIVVCFLLCLCLAACSTSKKSTAKPRDTPVPAKKDEDKVRVYDPATGTYVLVPRDAVKVDTVKWTEDKSDPILKDKEVTTKTPAKKSQYEVSVLIPLNSMSHTTLEGNLDPKLIRFLQYYGGMRMAAEEMKKEGLPIVVRSYDTELSAAELNEIMRDPAFKSSDVIVGPYDKDNLETVAAYGLEHEKFIVSPWLPAFNIEKENPFFIQMLPGLSTHAEAIMNFIGEEYNHKKIFLVARNIPAEIQRLTSFKKNPRVRTEDLIIDDATIDLNRTNLTFLLDDPDGTVFVMPYYSRQDEDFINSFMRKLHADKGTKDVIVFGLPQWTGFNNLNPNYMESLSLHISSSTFINTDHSGYRNFRQKFYSQYFTMPDNQAYLGYDLMMWIAKTIASEGAAGFLKPTPAAEFGLASGFNLKPVYKEGVKSTSEMKTPLYFENSRVRILEFREQDFELIK